MVDNNQDQINNQNPTQDPNQLSDEDLNAVNGGFGIPDFIEDAAKKVGNKIQETANDFVEGVEAAKEIYNKYK